MKIIKTKTEKIKFKK